jgi:hypothetical protein
MKTLQLIANGFGLLILASIFVPGVFAAIRLARTLISWVF